MKPENSIESVVLVGGKGGMGRLLHSQLDRAGVHTSILDKPLQSRDMQRTVPKADLVLISVPVNAFEEVVKTVSPFMTPETILADICSVKINPMRIMEKIYPGPVVGTHPLFGPEPAPDQCLRTAIVGSGKAAEQVSSLFKKMGHEPFSSNAEEHDSAMAYLQGLNFVTTLAYLCAAPAGVDITKFLTPSFERRLDAASKMVTQDSELFALICEANPTVAGSIRNFRSFLNVAAGGDMDLLREKALWWWRDNISGDQTG